MRVVSLHAKGEIAAFAQQNPTTPGAPAPPSAAPGSAQWPNNPIYPLYAPQPPMPYIFLGSPQIAACSRIPTSVTCSW